MKKNHAMAYLRQLCCSGLGKELVITEFLRTLPILIPSTSNVFSGVDAQLRPTYCIADFDMSEMAGTMVEVVSAFYTPERLSRAAAWLKRHPAITNPLLLDDRFYQSDIYNVVYRRFDMHHVLWLPTVDNGKPNGVLRLYRPKTQKPFGREDQALAGQLLPYLAHAIKAANDGQFRYEREATCGVIVMDLQGKVLFQSPEARKLLHAASNPALDANHDRGKALLLAELTRLCAKLQAASSGLSTSPPCYRHTGAAGEFLFHAYWLESQSGESGSLIGISAEHREPLKLKLLRSLQHSALSPTQKEVAMLLTQGISFEQIGQSLHIKPATVKDHVGKIYGKLDVRQRDEVLPKLLALRA